MHLKKRRMLSIILALIPYFIVSKIFASDSSDTVGSQRRSQKHPGIPDALIEARRYFP